MLRVYESVVSALELITGATPACAPDGSRAADAEPSTFFVQSFVGASCGYDVGPATAVIAVAPWRSASHKVQKTSRRVCLRKCPAAQWPDDEKAREPKRDTA